MSVYKFKIGDIVKVKGYTGVDYFIVTDRADFTKVNATKPDIECEIGQVFPVMRDFETFSMNQDKLELVAGRETNENAMIVNFVIKERQMKLGEYGEPMFVSVIKHNLGLVTHEDGMVMRVAQPPKQHKKPKRKFEDRINEILADNTAEKKIEEYAKDMDVHLELLYKAIQEDDKKEIEIQKNQLLTIRQELMKLEYFSFKQ